MNVILFGPPGVGKSTLIGHLKMLGKRAIDLEDLHPNRARFQVPNWVTDTYLGAADLDPKRRYNGSIRVLLYADQEQYVKRRKERDALQPGKASQEKHLMDDWLKGTKYDLILRTSDRSPEQTARTLISLVERGKSDK